MTCKGLVLGKEWSSGMTALRVSAHLPYESLKLLSNKHLTLKVCFLFTLALAIMVGQLHSLFIMYNFSGDGCFNLHPLCQDL